MEASAVTNVSELAEYSHMDEAVRDLILLNLAERPEASNILVIER